MIMATITERDRQVFNNLGRLNEDSQDRDMDVDVFFDLMDEMIDNYYDEIEKINGDNKREGF